MRNDRSPSVVLWFLCQLAGCCMLFVLAQPAGLAQSKPDYCDPAPEVKAALKKLSDEDGQLTLKQQRERRLALARDLLKHHPDDPFVNRRYQEAFLAIDDNERDTIIEEYRMRLEKKPDDPVSLYLYADALRGRRTPESIKLLERALQLAPNFARPHQMLVEIYQQPAYRDKAKTVEQVKAYAGKCPNSITAYSYFRLVDDPEFLRTSAPKLRTLLGQSKEPDELFYYMTLWQTEFKVKPIPEHVEVRKQIEGDLSRLRELNFTKNDRWYTTLREGYKMIGNKEGQRWAEEQYIDMRPTSSAAFSYYRERWDADHPRPTPNDPQEKRQLYNQALYQASAEWVKRWPDNVLAWNSRFGSATGLTDLPQAEVEAVLDGYLKALEKNPGTIITSPPLTMTIAQEYLKRNLKLDRIPELVQRGIQEMETRRRRDQQSDYLSPEQRQLFGNSLKTTQWFGWPILIDVYLKLNQPGKAREVLARMATALAKDKPEESARQQEKFAFAQHQVTYWDRSARLAEAESRKLDALTFYQNALSFRPKRSEKAKADKDELADKTRALWKELGGTEEGWQAWLIRGEASKSPVEVASSTPWENQTKPLPEFALNDLQGRKWQLADLKGKVAFINLWATWCGPCIQELPHVQKLYEQMKDRKDVLVLTLNIDSDVGVVEPFVKEKKYGFPVIPACSYAIDMMGGMISIPRNWLVGSDGVMRMEQVGFDGDGDDWMKKATEAIEKAKGGK